MLYLLDANVLITAHDNYYAIDRIPQFWEWIIYHAKLGQIKMPFEMLSEVKVGQPKRGVTNQDDELLRWLRRNNHEKDLLLGASVDQLTVNRVFKEGYELPHPTLDELNKVRKDPLLISYAVARQGTCIVTLEAKQENATDAKKGHNRKIPFVCRKLGVRCIDTFDLIRELNFRIPKSDSFKAEEV